MGAPAVTTTPFHVHARMDPPRHRRRGIWISVVGSLLTLLGAFAVLATRDGSSLPFGVLGDDRPASSTQAADTTGTTLIGAPPASRATGTIGSGGVGPGSSSTPAPPPATPQEVAELLAGLPQQLEQAANAGGQPHELTPEEVNKIVDDLLRQLGAKP